jgi:dTDP-4-dehydrorhamnose reductase
MMRILIAGSAGLLGSYLYRYCRRSGIEVMGLSRSEGPYTDIRGDATDFKWLSQQVRNTKCDVIVNTLKFKGSTDECEARREECWGANFLVPKKLAELQSELGFGLVQISTDWVFDGSNDRDNRESDVPYPRNFYAFSKYAAELVVAGCPKHIILRTTSLFGHELPARNFMARFLESTAAGKPFDAAIDQVSQPISALALSKIIVELLKKGGWQGVLHATGPDLLSRYELALLFAEHFNKPGNLVRPATSSVRTMFIPKTVRMDISKTEKIIGRKIEGVKRMLTELDAFEKQLPDKR